MKLGGVPLMQLSFVWKEGWESALLVPHTDTTLEQFWARPSRRVTLRDSSARRGEGWSKQRQGTELTEPKNSLRQGEVGRNEGEGDRQNSGAADTAESTKHSTEKTPKARLK